jgi:surfactin synthase thioesterase subunit
MEKPQLFLLHFAGGNCYSFHFISPLLSDFDVIPLELPGRGRRIGETLLNDFVLAAQDIYTQILGRLDCRTFMIYGHSMGAYIGLKVAHMLQESGKQPACLIVSGNAGPGVNKEKMVYSMAEDDFKKELQRLEGIPSEVIENRELFDFYEPILRADFEVAERNAVASIPAVDIPLFAMMGNREEDVAQIENWSKFTQSKFNYRILEGGHFFIHQHAGKIAGIIKDFFNHSILPI